MHVLGVDFTSAPRPAKPLAVAECWLDEARRTLRVVRVDALPTHAALAERLARGPFIAAMDFPFGLPRALLAWAGVVPSWAEMASWVGAFEDRAAFVATLRAFSDAHEGATGRREPKRATDSAARSTSAMHTGNPPVGLMLRAGVPLLRASGAHLPGLRAGDGGRVCVEGYPALAARRVVAGSYKNDPTGNDARSIAAARARRGARRRLVADLGAPEGVLARAYGVRVELDAGLARRLGREREADGLDAVLCALQGAWAWGRRDAGFGLPAGVDPGEGWIADPATATAGAEREGRRAG